MLDDLGIEFYEPYTRILDTSRGIAWPQWCVGGRMNIVHNCLDKWMGTPVEHRTALRWEGEEGAVRALTYGELVRRGQPVRATRCESLGVGHGRPRGAVHADVPRARRRLFRRRSRSAASSCRCSPATAPTPWRRGCATPRRRARDRRRLLAPRSARGDEDGGRSRRAAAAPSVRHVMVVSRLGRSGADAPGRDHRWSDLVARQADDCATRT